MAFSDFSEELKALQRCMSDLVSVQALPAIWNGQEPRGIVTTFHDALMATLNLDLLYLSVSIESDGKPIEVSETASHHATAQNSEEIRRALNEQFGDDPRNWPSEARSRLGGRETSLLSIRLGLEGEIGIVVAGSVRADFPTQSDRLLLGVAANQVTVGLQQAHLLSEQKRIADEFERRVAERTASLAAANRELKKEIDDRKRAEKALRESERNLNQTINTIPALTWSARMDGTAETFNQHYLDYIGLTQEQARDWGWTEAVHPDDLDGLANAWQSMVNTDAEGECEARLRRFDGEYRWFLLRANPLRDVSGKTVKWYGINTDIDDRKHAEEELRRSEARKTAILDSALDCIVTIDHEGRINEFNPAAERTFEYRRGDVLGRYLSDVIIPPSNREKHRKGLARYHATGEARVLGKRVELTAMRADGTEFPVELAISRIPMDGPPSFTGYLRDITQRRCAEEELRRSEAFLAEGQRLSRTGSFFWRVATEEIIWSEQLYRMFEFDPAMKMTLELIGSRIHSEDLHMLNDMVYRAQSGSDLEYEYRLLLPGDTVKYMHVVAHGTRKNDGAWEYIGAVQDVTERRLSWEALERARSELASATRINSLGILTASIAHEVNQPLSGIITNASTCLRMLNSDQPNIEGARETARRTIRDGNRASEVISRLRALFKKKEVAAESIDLNEATREVIALSLSELQSNRIMIRHQFAEDLPVVKGDRIQLQQVILNLLRNASDAMRDVDNRPRQLMIKTEPDDDDHVRLTVRDSGVGLDPKIADQLFESFYTTKEDGMGIGLSVSRSIIAAHQGRIWAAPNDGPGSTFAFSIPRETSHKSTSAQ